MTSTGSSDRGRTGGPAGTTRIRRGTLRDVPLLLRHRHRMWSDIGGRTERLIAAADPEYARWLRKRLPSGEVEAFIAVEGSAVAGSGCLWWREEQPRPGFATDDTPYVLSMYTEPDHRGHGVASAIVRAILGRARAEGAKRIVLHASLQGLPVYARLGFQRTREMRLDLVRIPGSPRAATPRGPARSPSSTAGGAGRGRRRRRSRPRGRSARSRRS